MTWAPRSRTDEEGNAYGSEREEEDEEEDEEDGSANWSWRRRSSGEEEATGGEGLADDDEDEEIDLENLDGVVAGPELALTGASARMATSAWNPSQTPRIATRTIARGA